MRLLCRIPGVSASALTLTPTPITTPTAFHTTKTLTSSFATSQRVHPSQRIVYRQQQQQQQHQARPPQRTFFTDSPSPSQRPPPLPLPPCRAISASRTLPYGAEALYKLIADIDSYASFLPYVLASTVLTRHPQTGAPLTADLRIGFPPFDETFRSAVTCTEPSLVEATSSPGSSVFDALRTRWEIRPMVPALAASAAADSDSDSDASSSVVDLRIEVGFKSRMYEVLAQAVIPKVAAEMIDAFEKRAREVLEVEEARDGCEGGVSSQGRGG